MTVSFRPWAALLLLTSLTWGCHCTHSPQTVNTPTPQYILSGGIKAAGRHDLHPGDTISIVLTRDLGASNVGAVTLVLMRHGPEGKSRELIQLNAIGQLMDEKQNYVLRDGDELIFPGGTTNPGGPNRPDLPPSRGGP
jgi:protein involved in polysaccharide export with SLBB domain